MKHVLFLLAVAKATAADGGALGPDTPSGVPDHDRGHGTGGTTSDGFERANAASAAPVPVTPVGNWTTVFRVGEKGFGCVRFPQLHRANGTVFMFVECYNRSGDHCNAAGMGFPNTPACHAYGNVCYKRSPDNGASWGDLEVVPINRSGTTLYARGHSTLHVPKENKICVHYNTANPRPTGGFPAGGRKQQCLDLATQTWSDQQDIGAGIGAECNQFLGSRQTNVVLPSGRQLWSSWSFADKAFPNMVCIYATDDGGATFKTLAIVNQTSETALALLGADDDAVYYNARHVGAGIGRVTGRSTDGGVTWSIERNSTHSPPDTKTDSVPGPVLRVDGAGGAGARGVASAMLLSLPLGPGRSNIALHVSVDGGNTWQPPRQLDTGYGGYSGLVQLGEPNANGSVPVGVAYESDPLPGMRCTGACSVRFMRVSVG